MIVATALRLAGPGAHLVARPTGVAHVYTGPLTPSGRFVPRNHRTACRAHTRQLRVLTPEHLTLAGDRGLGKRMCARCSACLSTAPAASRQAEPTTRDDYVTRYGHLTPLDLAVEAAGVQSAAELDVVAHLSLVLFGVAGCNRPVTDPTGNQVATSLHKHIGYHRARLCGLDENPLDARLRELGDAARFHRKAERAELYRQREERIARLGFNRATTK